MSIAIIGFSFNLPGVRSVNELSQLFLSGKDAYSYPNTSRSDKENWVESAGYISGENEFDYKLFGLSLRDSLIIEPQQRMFIQHSWQALEFAGYNPAAIEESVGVFSSSSDSRFNEFLKTSTLDIDKYEPFEIEIGANKEQQSLRTAFLLNTHSTCRDAVTDGWRLPNGRRGRQ